MSGNRILTVLLALLLLFALLYVAVLNPPDRDRGAPPAPPAGGTVAAAPEGTPGGPGGAEAAGGTAGPGAGTGEDGGAAAGGEEAAEEDFSLTEPGPTSFAVRVLDHEGNALEASVEILIVDQGHWPLGVVETGEDGAARGFLPGPGRYVAVADAGGTRRETGFTVGKEGEAAEVAILLPGSAVLSGRVTGESGGLGEDLHGEQRLTGEVDLLVEVFFAEGEPPLFSGVDAAGRYRIAGLPPGTHVLAVRSKFHAERVEIGEGEDRAHDVVLPEGCISGRVFEEWSGKPAQETQVVVQLRSAPSDVQRVFAGLGFPRLHDRMSPDPDGRYAFTNLPDGEYALFANGLGYGVCPGAASIGPGSREAALDFPMKQGAAILLGIRDAEGNDLEGCLCMTGGILFGFTGRVEGFTVGKQDFLAWAPGHAIVVKKDVELRPGDPTPIDFVLPPAAVTRLRFVDPEGAPQEGVRVSAPRDGHDLQAVMTVLRRGSPTPFTESGSDGIVVVAGATAGPCRITARKSGFATFDREVELPAGGGEVPVTLLPADTSFRRGVRITGVTPGGQADLLELRPGDEIVSYAGTEVSSLRELQAAMEATTGDGGVPLVLRRGGERVEVEVAPGVLGVSLAEFEE